MVVKAHTVVVHSVEKIQAKLTALLLMLPATSQKTWWLQVFATKYWYRFLTQLVWHSQ